MFIHENLPQLECSSFLGRSTLIPEIKMFVHENLPQWECVYIPFNTFIFHFKNTKIQFWRDEVKNSEVDEYL